MIAETKLAAFERQKYNDRYKEMRKDAVKRANERIKARGGKKFLTE